MRIAVIQDSIDAGKGGAETSTRELAAALADLGQQVTVVGRGTPAAEPAPSGEPFELVRLAATGFNKAAQTRSYLAQAAEFCRNARFDVVHAIAPCPAADVYQPRGGLYPAAIAASLAATRHPVARLLKQAARRFHVKQQLLIAAERRLLTRPDPPWIAPVSEFAAAEVARHFPAFPQARVRTIFNAVRLEPPPGPAWHAARSRGRAAAGLDRPPAPDTRLILFVGHNFALKGLRELLTALARLDAEPPHAPWRLLVVGRDEPRPFRDLAHGLSLADKVTFAGAAADVGALYAAADMLAHPTWYDPCSRVVLEALRHGLPCLTTQRNGAAEALRSAADGLVIPRPDDLSAFAGALRDLLARPLRAGPAADPRRDLAMRRHAEELLNLYERIATARRA